MTITTCTCCGGDYHWQWEDAFDKFGFGDGDGIVMTGVVADTLRKAGYEVDHQAFGIHNTVITSIRKNGADLIPVGAVDLGYDDPHDYLPDDIIELLQKAFPEEARVEQDD